MISNKTNRTHFPPANPMGTVEQLGQKSTPSMSVPKPVILRLGVAGDDLYYHI